MISKDLIHADYLFIWNYFQLRCSYRMTPCRLSALCFFLLMLKMPPGLFKINFKSWHALVITAVYLFKGDSPAWEKLNLCSGRTSSAAWTRVNQLISSSESVWQLLRQRLLWFKTLFFKLLVKYFTNMKKNNSWYFYVLSSCSLWTKKKTVNLTDDKDFLIVQMCICVY